jgi:uncharacterized protein (TIGR02246 family)
MMVAELLDAEVAIRQVMTAYMDACDRHDPEDVVALFTEDAVWEDPADPSATLLGLEAIRSSYAEATTRLTFCVHYLTNERIAVEGDRAVAQWSYFEPAINRGTVAVWTAGRYSIDFRKVHNRWYFSRFRLSAQLAAPYADGWIPEPKVVLP